MSKKITDNPIVYIKNKRTVFIEDTFIYEVTICAYFPNYFSVVNTTYFSCKHEIPFIVESFWKNPHTEICCELYAAPLNWLLDNGFTVYIKPEKKRITKKNNDESKTIIT